MNARYLVLMSVLFVVVGMAIRSRSTLMPQPQGNGVDHVFYAGYSDFIAQEVAIGDFDGDGLDDIVTTIKWEDQSDCDAPSQKISSSFACDSLYTRWVATKGVEDTLICGFPDPVIADLQRDYWVQCGWTIVDTLSCGECWEAVWFREDNGAALVFLGGSWSGKPAEIDLDGDINADHMIVGGQAGDLIHNGIGAGDVTVDAYDADELVLGADQPNTGPGEVYVIGGNTAAEPWPTQSQAMIVLPTDTLVDHYFKGRDSGDLFGMGIVVGDLDGDGDAEVVVAAPGGDGPNNDLEDSGEIYIFYSCDSLPATKDLSTLLDADFDGPSGSASSYAQVIWGGAAGDRTGVTHLQEVHEEHQRNGSYDPVGLAIGDWNGDGFNDLAIGAGESRGGDGTVYVIFGASLSDQTRKLQPGKTLKLYRALGDPAAPDFKIVGKSGSRLGAGIAFVDADGQGPPPPAGTGEDDLVMGAPYADLGGSAAIWEYHGEAYIIWGADSLSSGSLSVANHANVTIHGQDKDDQLGGHISGNYDIDGDGKSDFGIAGQDVSFVLFGRTRSDWEATIDLETSLTANRGLRVLKWTSSPAPNSMTIRLLDLNGDEERDLVFGGYDNPGYLGEPATIHSGQMWVTRGWDMWKKGTISANTTWSGIAFVDGDITVESGKTLTISPGSHIWVWQQDAERAGVDTMRVEINVEGTLVADGTAANPIIFESWDWETQTNEDWIGFYFDSQSGGGTFDHCVIKRAEYAIESYSDVSVTNTVIEDCRYAGVVGHDGDVLVRGCTITDVGAWGVFLTSADGTVRGTTVENATAAAVHVQPNATLVASTSSFLNGDTGVYINASASVTLDTLEVNGNDVGISCYNSNPSISLSEIESNTSTGIYIDYYSHPTIDDCTIGYNPTGIYCADNSDPLVTACTISNSTVGITAVDDADPDLGHTGVSGQNSVTVSSSHHFVNLSAGITIMAEDNWWGSSPPKASKFSGSVDYTPYLGSAPSPVSMQPETPEKLPSTLALGTVSPNPFNPATTIRYDVPRPGGAITIRVYDVAGRLVRELVNEFIPAGFHEVRWDGIGNRGEPIASGVYFVQMRSESFAQAKKLVLLK